MMTTTEASGRALLLAGAGWEAARFFLVLSALAAALRTGAVADVSVYPWLLFVSSGSLLAAAAGALSALLPQRFRGVIALLRLGKGISLLAFVLALVAAGKGGAGRLVLPLGIPLVFVPMIDTVILLALWRTREPARATR